MKKKKDIVSLQQIKDVLYSLYNNHGLFIVYFTFGEPLLSPYFGDISQYCDSLGLIQILMTNGSLIDSQSIETIKNNHIAKTYISLDSSIPEQHDKNRNFEGAYNLAINALIKLKKAGANCGIATTINDCNVDQLYDIKKIGTDIGVDSLSVLRERKNGRIVDLNNLPVYLSFIQEYLQQEVNTKVPNLFLHDPTIRPFLNKLYIDGIISQLTYEKYYDMNSCHRLNTLSLEPNGIVSHCNLVQNQIGNLFTSTIDEILQMECDNNEYPFCCPCLSWTS